MNKAISISEKGIQSETPDVVRERLRDPKYLPTHDEINMAFPVNDYEGRQVWRNYCDNVDNPVFEFLNKEHIDAFATYLSQRIEDLGADESRPVSILEVGAGSGRLAHFVREALDKKIPDKFRLVAADNGSRQIKPKFPVENMDYKEAIEKYNPDVVISSWMPSNEDWTRAFRKGKGLKEYILIGEVEGGSCGAASTWGVLDENLNTLPADSVPEYEQDGFQRIDLDDLAKLQISTADTPGDYFNSSTVSFRRV